MAKGVALCCALACLLGASAAIRLDVTAHKGLHAGLQYDPFPFPYVGEGKCDEPVHDEESGLTSVRCVGHKITLAPGQTKNVITKLDNPYPADGTVQVVAMTGQLVDSTGRAVPLDEVYVHHYVGDPRFILGSGAELRGSNARTPLAEPLALLVNAKDGANQTLRRTDVQLINTIGVPEEARRQCLECWCGPEHPDHGSFFCCKDCPTSSDAAPIDYFLEHNVTYRRVSEEQAAALEQVHFMGFDVTGGKIEYDILRPQGPHTTHRQAMETVMDARCPQRKPFRVVRCTAHQHVGARCARVIDLDNDALICESCPVFGTQPGVAGNEDGYVVRITDDEVDYTVQPGTRVRVESDYSAEERRLGVMGLMTMWVAGLEEPCTGQFGYPMSVGHMAEAAQLYLRGVSA